MSFGDDPRYVRVVCPKCRAVLHPRVERAGRQVRCPDCYSAVLVPEPPKPMAAPKRREPGEYGVRAALAPARNEAESANFFLVLCPKCQAHLHPKRSHAGKRARCPDCDSVFVVPNPPKPETAKALPSPGKYAMGEESKRIEPEFHYLTTERVNEPEPEPAAPPDDGWFFLGVFTFPWWPGAWARWMILSMLLVPAVFMSGLLILLAGGDVSKGMTIVPYLILPLIWLWVWALSYAAACFVAIVQDTGSGNDEVSSWPEGDWRERVSTMLYVGLHLGLSVAAASALAWPIGMFTEPIWGAVATGLISVLLFPLFFLSSMEADTLLTPYSPLMFGSLVKSPGGWLIIYVETLVVFAVALGLIGAGLYVVPVLAALLASPVLSTMIFIAARLYGRLAWHIGRLETKRNAPKRKKKAAHSIAAPPAR